MQMSSVSECTFIALFAQFCIPRQVDYPMFGTMGHVSPHVWTTAATNTTTTQDDGGDGIDACALCCQKHTTLWRMSRKSIVLIDLHHIDLHISGDKTVYAVLQMSHFVVQSETADFVLCCAVLCCVVLCCVVFYALQGWFWG